MRRTPLFVTFGIAVFLTGCSGGPPPGLRPPELSVVEISFNELDVFWGRPSVEVDGYELEGQLPGGDWESLGDRIPARVKGVRIDLDPSVPERIELGFRLRFVVGTQYSDWASASIHRGISPPGSFVASAAGVVGGKIPPVTVSWQNVSHFATELRLERAPVDAAGHPGVFVIIPGVVFPATSFSDDTVLEGTWQYRISSGAQGEWSNPVVSTVGVDVLPPAGLTAHQIAGGVQLDWTPRSAVATSQDVERLDPHASGPTPLANEPPEVHSYVDPIEAPWPVATYLVSARVSSGAAAITAVLGRVHVSGSFPLTGTAATTPDMSEIFRTDQGLLHGISNGSAALTYYRDTGSGWDAFSPSGTPFNAGLFADAAGRLHVLYATSFSGWPQTPLEHAWHDGTQWRSEEVTSTQAALLDAAVTPAGVVHALTQHQDSSGAWVIVHTVGSGGSFSSRDLVLSVLPPPPPPATRWTCSPGHMDVASDETDWVAFACFVPQVTETSYVMFHRAPGGTWSEELAPFTGSGNTAIPVAGQGASAALLHAAVQPGDPDWRIHVRSAAGWGPEETLPSEVHAMRLVGLVLPPGGERMAVACLDISTGMWLAERTAAGWTALPIGAPGAPWTLSPRIRLGASGQVIITVPHGPSADGRPNASIYVEDP